MAKISSEQPPLEVKWIRLQYPECLLFPNPVSLWHLASIFERETLQLVETVPAANHSLLCSTTGWTIDWYAVVGWARARVDAIGGPIYSSKDEVRARTTTSVWIPDVRELVDDCTADPWADQRLAFGMECQIGPPWKQIVQVHWARIVGTREGVESVPGHIVQSALGNTMIILSRRESIHVQKYEHFLVRR